MTNRSSVGASAKRKAYINIVLPLFIVSTIAYIDRINLGYAALTMNKDLGFSASTFGLGAGIFFAGYLVFSVPGALLAERFSPKFWIAGVLIAWGVASGLTAFVTNATEFYLVRFLLGASEASLYPVLYACFIPRWFSSKDRAGALSILLTSLQISSIIGAPLAGWLVGVPLLHYKGWQVLFIIEAIPAVLFAGIVVFWLEDWPRDAKWLTAEEKLFLTEQYEQEILNTGPGSYKTVWSALVDVEVIKLCLIYFLWVTGFWGLSYWMPTVLKSALGWSNLAVGWIIVLPMSLSLISMVWLGHHSSKTGERRWHGAGGMFLAAIGMLVGATSHNPMLSLIFICIAAIGVYAPMGVWWSYPTTFLSGSAAAGAIGLINSCGNTGGFVGPYLIGLLQTLTGSFTIGWVYLAFSLACAGMLILTFKKEPPKLAISPVSVEFEYPAELRD